MKSFSSKLALFLPALLIVLCNSCDKAELPAIAPAGKPKVSEEKQPVAKVPAEPSDVVAKIDDYRITRGELEKRLIIELRPDSDAEFPKVGHVDAKTLLMRMIAEKAMMMEARKKNYLEDKILAASMKRFKERKLVNLLLRTYLQGKVTVTNAEIDEVIKANPRVDRTRAEVTIKRGKSNKLVEQFYNEICQRRRVQKVRDNFPRAAQIYQRLLRSSAKRHKMPYVRIKQVEDELTPEERNLTLAKFDNRKVTLREWFDALGKYSPPSHPKDLHTVEGVERLLAHTMRTPIFVAEAGSRGLDNDENFLKQVKEREDMLLFGKIWREKLKDIKDPTTEQVIAYFNKNKEDFALPERLRIDQIWCQNLKTAREVKAQLDGGADFETVRQKYSLEKKHRPWSADLISEGLFFKDLQRAETNEIVGPIKGFYRRRFRWRIVKVLKKYPGKLIEYSSDMERRVKDRMWEEQRDKILAEYRKELLKEYPYRIYPERIADIDPLDIP